MRSHYCGQVDESLIGQEVDVCGWVHRRRDHGGVIFIDLRDREGLLQVVFDPDRAEIFAEAERIRSEYVLRGQGPGPRQRPRARSIPNMRTGQVEVLAHELEILNRSETPPFHHDEQANEELRLTYRYLDLRREDMLGNLRLRHKVTRAHARISRRPRIRRRRNADADARHARRRARLHRAEPHQSGQVFCVAAVAANLQAAADDVRASIATTRSCAASATKTCAPIVSPSSRSSISR